ncbi:MAG: glycosyltransferase family 2 protein [Actinomycetota bacterium]|nr:glycosyltransferase family 2 protein [Actinomycetota bacterium]
MTTKIVAIVPATDAPATLDRCMSAIVSALEPPEDVRVIDDPAVQGPARARNLGAEETSGEPLVFAFIDADVEVHPDAFVRIRRAFDEDPDLVAVFGSYDDDPERHGLVSDFRNLLHHHVHQTGAGPAGTFWAGLGAIRRDGFLEIGGFDEARFPHPSVEDIELGMRIAARGGRIELDPALQGKHLKHWTLREMVRTDLFRRGIPWVRLVLADGATPSGLNLAWRHRVSAVAALALVAALAARRPKLAGPPLVLLLTLNGSFYGLVYRKRGLVAAVSAVPLHVLHHLTSVTAVPLALAAHLLDRHGSSHRA